MGMSTRGRFTGDDPDLNSVWLDTHGDCHTVTARERIRRQLAYDMEEFLNRGGTIQHLEPHMRAENMKDSVDEL